MFIATIVCSGQNSVGIFKLHQDIGKPQLAGNIYYNKEDQSYDIKGAGYNIWFSRDEFYYAYQNLKGDFILTANFKFINKGSNPHRKVGWMVRANDSEDAAHMTATVHGDGLTTLQWRRKKGVDMRDPQDEIFTKISAPEIIQLERIGKQFIMRVANPGGALQEIGRTDSIDLPNHVLAGIFIGSHDPKIIEEAKIWNVKIEKPVKNK